jgi:hypothetical protein
LVEREAIRNDLDFSTDEPIAIPIDGQLVSDCVDAVETCIQRAIVQRRPVHLFLRDISHIDEHGGTQSSGKRRSNSAPLESTARI